MNTDKHDFFDFMKSIKDSMASEYSRIQKRVLEDPGTAGDQGEENWAQFLRNWLPANYPVVTKGRILGAQGASSPQVDVLVLHPSYPIQLRDKKHYFAGGVVAAFECKLTLKRVHIKEAFQTASVIKKMLFKRTGNPFDELHQPPIVGLLAHSHSWKSRDKEGEKIHNYISEYECAFSDHPREMLDLICIADLGSYILQKDVAVGPHVTSDDKEILKDFEIEEGIETCFWGCEEDEHRSVYDSRGDILATLVCELTEKMAFEDSSLRPFAHYLQSIGIYGGIGRPMFWDKSILSEPVLRRLNKEGYEEDGIWSKWAAHF
jgi:hypothetical protein